ncbi:MAG TPA: SDR family oxidoreductase [Methanofastidiosum sp.]|nr:SDR family oxidoreductase [Methanofastidiosum sp.]HQK63307.1 SDR family oxidoreductase [Methanofastidiosum sp.]
MKIIVLGATGMLGHKMLQTLNDEHEVIGTVRGDEKKYKDHPLLGNFNLIGNVKSEDIKIIKELIEKQKPNVVINCIGIVKQLPTAKDPIQSIMVNSLFPHQMAQICNNSNIRFIHFSTDCVFSGKKGNYIESDQSDAEDLYGKTKFLGEVNYPNSLTIRTSIIGREINSKNGLLEWFLSKKGQSVKGYSHAFFSGLTTYALSKIVSKIISDFDSLSGIWHISSKPISKYSLLTKINEKFNLGISIVSEYSVIYNKTLDSSKFVQATDIKIPSWDKMIDDLYKDSKLYE